MNNLKQQVLWVVAAASILLTGPALAQIYYVEDMNTQEIEALDRAKTVVIMPGGILEEHGPYLPSNTDGYISDALVRDVADAIVARGMQVLIFPRLTLGSGGANELAAKYPYPGTYAVRLDTLRAVYMDLGDELGEAGFKWVLLIHVHGAPNHNRILREATAYFSDTHDGIMRHITGIHSITAPQALRSNLSETALKEDASSGHAGIEETSLMLFLRPDLVDPAYVNAPSLPADAEHGWMPGVATQEGWPGYFGAPKFSSAEYGAKLYADISARFVQEAMDTLDGNPKPINLGGAARGIDNAAMARDQAIEKRQQDWLKEKGIQ